MSRTPFLHPGPPPFFCRKHGEPLVHSVQHLAWRCPEIAVCGTWVGEEYRFVTSERRYPRGHLQAITRQAIGQKTWEVIRRG